MKKAFLLDLNRCTGCHACVLACANENGLAPGRNWRQVYFYNEDRHPDLPRVNLSLACNHCDEPACLENCPAAAYTRDEATGSVTLDPQRCMGCKYCTWACPFDVPVYNEEQGVVEKCTFCVERLEAGLEPACVACCPTGALQLADRQPEADPPRIPGFSRTRLKPALRFVPLRGQRHQPECTAPPDRDVVNLLHSRSLPRLAKKSSLRSEWALVLFTTLAALLAALLAAALVAGFRPEPLLFLGSGGVVMLLSSAHLGRKWRAWRSILNWRHSWLSLEILSFGAFMGLAGLFLIFFSGWTWLGWLAAGIGFFSLLVIDKVYQVALKTGPFHFHSAQVFFTGLYLAGILALQPLAIGLVGAAKLYLYLRRKIRCIRLRRDVHSWISVLRLGLGFVLPALLLSFFRESALPAHGLAVAAAIAGDLIDRGEFYADLEVPTPQWQILVDLEKALQDARGGSR